MVAVMVAKVMAAPVAITAALVKATMALAAMLLVMMATLVSAHGQKHTSLSVSPARPTFLIAPSHARVPLAAQSPLKLGFAPTTLALVTLLVAYLYGPCGWPI